MIQQLRRCGRADTRNQPNRLDAFTLRARPTNAVRFPLGGLKRDMVRDLLNQLSQQYPGIKDSLFASLRNVRTSHLMDPRLSASRAHRGRLATGESEREA